MHARLNVVTLGVDDLDRSLRFYRDGLGWKPAVAGSGEAILGTSRIRTDTHGRSPGTRTGSWTITGGSSCDRSNSPHT